MINPNYIPAYGDLRRDREADRAVLQEIVSSWPPDRPEITLPELVDAFAARLTADEIMGVQEVYRRGLGDYVAELVGLS